MSYIGNGSYYAQQCLKCGGILWNGHCENPDCEYHWHPLEDTPAEPSCKEGGTG